MFSSKNFSPEVDFFLGGEEGVYTELLHLEGMGEGSRLDRPKIGGGGGGGFSIGSRKGTKLVHPHIIGFFFVYDT